MTGCSDLAGTGYPPLKGPLGFLSTPMPSPQAHWRPRVFRRGEQRDVPARAVAHTQSG
jgi:hypothetical protein